MIIYNYNKEGYYTYSENAFESPLEPGVFIIPARATTIDPPECEPGFIPCFSEETGEWEVVDISLQEAPLDTTPEVLKTQAEILTAKNQQLEEQAVIMGSQITELNGVVTDLIQLLADKGVIV